MTEPVAAKPDQQTPASNAYTTSDQAPSKFGARVYSATDSDCKRSGFTLIETVTMFSLMSVLAISSLSILNAISQNGIELAKSHQTRRDALRLADSVREDAATSSNANPSNDGNAINQWSFTFEKGKTTTTYEWMTDINAIRRIERSDGETIRTDRFLLPRDAKPKMTIDQNTITLQVNLPGKGRQWVIEGTLSRGGEKP